MFISYCIRQHVHFIRQNAYLILYSSACSFHTVFISMLISYCIRQPSYFELFSSASLFRTVFVSIRQHIHFILYSSALFSFHTVFDSLLISNCFRQHLYFELYSSACSFHAVFVSVFISFYIRQHSSAYSFHTVIVSAEPRPLIKM